MIVWHGELEMPRLDPESCLGRSPLIDDLLAAGMRGSSRWFLNVLTLDVDVTIISAALIDPGSPPHTSFGISADPDPGAGADACARRVDADTDSRQPPRRGAR